MKANSGIIMRTIASMSLFIVLAPYAVAAEGKTSPHRQHRATAMSAKKTNSISHLQDAASRSFEDHGKMKKKVHEEKANRQAAWAERGTGAIEIQGSGAFTGMEYLSEGAHHDGPGAGEVDIYDHGTDLSGLQSLKSQVSLDNTDADFDAELSEINRGIDSDISTEEKKTASKAVHKK